MKSRSTTNRRQFLQRVSLATAGATIGLNAASAARVIGANERVNIGFIGSGGQANYSLESLKTQNIVALCDVDSARLNTAAQRAPAATRHQDFRALIDQKNIDAIVVATPDHTHAVTAAAVLRSGRDLYCEKPLTRTISEARALTELAKEQKAVTQMGTQIHAGGNYRRVVELIQKGYLGAVREVHVWVSSSYGGMERPKETPPVPPDLNWDLWLGPVPARPYHPDYAPFKWRHWWAFGGGSLADFGCHFMDLAFWALGLGAPSSVVTVDGPPVHAESTPPWLVMAYEFPARPKNEFQYPQPAVKLTWYHGTKETMRYPKDLVSPELVSKFKSGVLFVGEKGMLLSNYTAHLLLPENKWTNLARPRPFIRDSVGHHQEWIEAIKTRGTPTCHFSYAGPLTEAVLLGNVAYRTGKKIDWDSAKLIARNCPEATPFIQHQYRDGWKL